MDQKMQLRVQSIESAGLLPEALRSRLPDRGHQELRDLLQSGVLFGDLESERPTGHRGVVFQASKPGDYPAALHTTHTFVKEMMLLGYTAVTVHYLTGILSSMREDGGDPCEFLGVCGEEFIFVQDFYRHGHESPLMGYERYAVQTILSEAMRGGMGVLVLGDSRISHWKNWWDESFLAQLMEHNHSYEL